MAETNNKTKPKDFFDIRELSKAFREDLPKLAPTEVLKASAGQYWYCVSTLAVAQQLSVISSTLRDIYELLSNPPKG